MRFALNNGRAMIATQRKPDGPVTVQIVTGIGEEVQRHELGPERVVMLWNLYHYIMERDIKNDFINPNGRNHDE